MEDQDTGSPCSRRSVEAPLSDEQRAAPAKARRRGLLAELKPPDTAGVAG